jgi:hypothetical protein
VQTSSKAFALIAGLCLFNTTLYNTHKAYAELKIYPAAIYKVAFAYQSSAKLKAVITQLLISILV